MFQKLNPNVILGLKAALVLFLNIPPPLFANAATALRTGASKISINSMLDIFILPGYLVIDSTIAACVLNIVTNVVKLHQGAARLRA